MYFLRGFFYRLADSYRRFMIGRYGVDALNTFLLVLTIALSLLARVFRSPILSLISWIPLLWLCFRMYSRNISKRYEEGQKFLKIKASFTARVKVWKDAWNNRKTHKYFRCKVCKTSIRLPRGVGKVKVTCPKCRNIILKKA